MLQCNVFPGLPPDFLDSEVNLFLVPFMDSEAESENPPRAGMVPPQGDWSFLGLEGTDPPWSEERLWSVPKVLGPFLKSMFPACGNTGRAGPGLTSGCPGGSGHWLTGRKVLSWQTISLNLPTSTSRTQFQPTLFPTPWVPGPPQFPVFGEQAPEPSDVHGAATAVTHNPH